MAARNTKNDPNGEGISRRGFLGLGLGAGAAAALAACAPDAPAPDVKDPAAPPRLATHVSTATPTLSSTLDPNSAIDVPTSQALRQFSDALVAFSDDGTEIVGQLAHDWERIDDHTVEFRLRDDVRFSNGEDFTAETVKFTIERLLESDNPIHVSTRTRMGPLAGAEVVNSTTVRVITSTPDPIHLNRMTLLYMVPEGYIRNGGDMDTQPIGTGSFVVTDSDPGAEVRYEAWDGSWRGTSTLETASITRIAEPATMVSALRAGEIDIVYRPQPDQVAALEREGFNVTSISDSTCTIMTVVPRNSDFDDPRVRQAMNLAVNKEELLATVQAGFGEVATAQLIQPGMLGYREDFDPFPYDPERARALFEEAGVAGQEVVISMTAELRAVGEAVLGYLNAAGVRAVSDVFEVSVLSQALNQGTDRPILTWSTNYFHMRDFDSAGHRFSPDTAQPYLENEEYNRLWAAARQEMDISRREQMIRDMAGIMRDEYAALFLLWRRSPTVYTSAITHLEQIYDGSYRFWTLEKQA